MATTLDRAVEASEIVVALKPFGVTQGDVAAAPIGMTGSLTSATS